VNITAEKYIFPQYYQEVMFISCG